KEASGLKICQGDLHESTAHGPSKEKHEGKSASIFVIEGTLTKEQVQAELERLVSAKWAWNIHDMGNNSFRVTFPSMGEMQRMIEWGATVDDEVKGEVNVVKQVLFSATEDVRSYIAEEVRIQNELIGIKAESFRRGVR
ncbi:hypothetical protein ACJX0J_032081, partial [Zea mays]